MTLHLGDVPASSTLYIPFDTIAEGVGSITISGLAVTDIEIYKNGSVTQRSSDAGYALLDTDGIDFDSITGVHGFSVDLSDNTDAGFYAVGSFYWVVVSSITVNGQTVSFIAATFRIVTAEAIAGKPKVDVDAWLGTAAATPTVAGVPEVDVTHWIGTAAATPTVAGVPEVDLTHVNGAAQTATLDTIKAQTAAIETDTAEIGAAGAGLTEAGGTGDQLTALATAANLATAAGYIDTEIQQIIADTEDIQTQIGVAGAGLTAIPLMTTQLTEAYAADGAAPTPAQALFLIQQMLTEMSISGTTMTVKKLDGATTAATLTLNDATTPTSVTRAT